MNSVFKFYVKFHKKFPTYNDVKLIEMKKKINDIPLVV